MVTGNSIILFEGDLKNMYYSTPFEDINFYHFNLSREEAINADIIIYIDKIIF